MGGKTTGIPYKGSALSTQALLAGEVNLTDNWHAILLPANAPRANRAKLHAEMKAARHPDVAAKVAPGGVEIVTSTPEELQARAASEREYWSRQICLLGIKAD